MYRQRRGPTFPHRPDWAIIMAVTDDKKGPIEHTLDVFVFLPLGFVLELPSSIPQYIDRGRRELSPRRLLARGGGAGFPSLADAGDRLSRLQEQTHSTLRALGVSVPGFGAHGAARGNGQGPTNAQGADAALESDAAAPVTPTPRPSAIFPAVPTAPAPDPSALAITDYDSLSASQVVPRLDSLAADELEGIRVYEASTRGRKTILNKIAQLQSA